jgi:hypothetical protein
MMKELIMRPEGRRTLPKQLHDDLGLTKGKRPVDADRKLTHL